MHGQSLKNETILQSLYKLKPYSADNIHLHPPNDLGNGQLFADVFGKICRYNKTTGLYMYYDGTRWVDDAGNINADNLAKKLTRVLPIYLTQADISDERFQKNASRLMDRRTRTVMLQDAQSYHAITSDDLDADGELLNLQNGTLNLKSFKLLPHNPDDLISKVCNTSFAPGARSDAWETFVRQVMMDDREKMEYLQRTCGYSLLGYAPEDEFYLWYGKTTRNGKSTMLGTIGHLLGDYAAILPPDELAQRQSTSGGKNNDYLADLRGARFVSVSEPSKGIILDAGTIKNLTGKDVFRASRKYEHPVNINPVFKIFIGSNYLPVVTDNTVFSSGRVKVITFDRHFEEEEQDKNLLHKLESAENAPGILNWMLQGLRNYYQHGTVPPAAIRDAVSEYADESDKLGNFIIDKLEPAEGQCLPVKRGYEIFAQWCTENGYGIDNKRNFTQELKRRGLYKASGTVNGHTVRNVIAGYKESCPFIPIPSNTGVPF